MGCASSAALPFLTNRGNQAAAESPKMNGQPPYELKMVNNKLKENGIANAKDINESYVSEKMKEVVDSTTVQGVIGGVVQAKDEVVNQVKGFGEAVSEKVTSAVEGVEDTIESAFGKLTHAVESTEEKLKAEVESLEDDVKSLVNGGREGEGKGSEMKAEDIDELLESLPTEEELAEAVKGKKEEEEEEKREEGEGEREGN